MNILIYLGVCVLFSGDLIDIAHGRPYGNDSSYRPSKDQFPVFYFPWLRSGERSHDPLFYPPDLVNLLHRKSSEGNPMLQALRTERADPFSTADKENTNNKVNILSNVDGDVITAESKLDNKRYKNVELGKEDRNGRGLIETRVIRNQIDCQNDSSVAREMSGPSSKLWGEEMRGKNSENANKVRIMVHETVDPNYVWRQHLGSRFLDDTDDFEAAFFGSLLENIFGKPKFTRKRSVNKYKADNIGIHDLHVVAGSTANAINTKVSDKSDANDVKAALSTSANTVTISVANKNVSDGKSYSAAGMNAEELPSVNQKNNSDEGTTLTRADSENTSFLNTNNTRDAKSAVMTGSTLEFTSFSKSDGNENKSKVIREINTETATYETTEGHVTVMTGVNTGTPTVKLVNYYEKLTVVPEANVGTTSQEKSGIIHHVNSTVVKGVSVNITSDAGNYVHDGQSATVTASEQTTATELDVEGSKLATTRKFPMKLEQNYLAKEDYDPPISISVINKMEQGTPQFGGNPVLNFFRKLFGTN